MLAAAIQLALALSPGPSVAPETTPPAEAVTVPQPAEVPMPAALAEPAAPIVAPVAPAPVVAPVEPVEPSPAFEAPAAVFGVPTPEIELPRFRGIGMLVSGGLVGLVAIPLKITATAADVGQAASIDRGESDPDPCIEICYAGSIINVLSLPLHMTSAGLLGGGTTMYGRWAAHRDAARGRAFATRRARIMMGVGFGALGAGLTAFVASRLTLHDTATESQSVARRELGWWGALAGLYVGSSLAGYGVGYLGGQRHVERRLQASVTPMLSPQLVGLGVSGRF
jgi:hypothetical protein